jgi:hypothetical protein
MRAKIGEPIAKPTSRRAKGTREEPDQFFAISAFFAVNS